MYCRINMTGYRMNSHPMYQVKRAGETVRITVGSGSQFAPRNAIIGTLENTMANSAGNGYLLYAGCIIHLTGSAIPGVAVNRVLHYTCYTANIVFGRNESPAGAAIRAAKNATRYTTSQHDLVVPAVKCECA